MQLTLSTDIVASSIEPIDILAILPGGIIESNLSLIPPNPHRYRFIFVDSFKKIGDRKECMTRIAYWQQ
jgi:hypothetical protein